MNSEKPFRSGIVALLGKPNAGKSTLMNAITGAKLSAVSALPQTTRERTAGVYTDDNCQIVFADLPGLMKPLDRLNETLRDNVLDGITQVDAVLHLVDVGDDRPFPDEMVEALARVKAPVILAVNKVDGKRAQVDAGSWAGEKISAEQRRLYRAIIGISAQAGKNLQELVALIVKLLPEGPHLYDEDVITDKDLRFLAQEMIREKLFLHLHEELPYATAVLVDEFKEREGAKWFISATIYVERESQKGMVIGKGAGMLKRISSAARVDIEQLCDAPVFLELRVKVRENWRKKENDLRFFGYQGKKPKFKHKKKP
ncbi:GTPase Era [Candidatus Sumerlaeota bacterium]|nr:GTPase Era [Candidatus Sumerlaeota bacterium]